jgi:hypothetical protein
VQQDPLIAGGDVEEVANLVAGESFHVAQHDHLALAGRKVFESGLEDWRPSRRLETVIGFGPAFHGIRPLPAGVESDGVDGMMRLECGMTLLEGAG